MRRLRATVLLACVPAVCAASGGFASPEQTMVEQLLRLVNQARSDYKLPPLALDLKLSAAAQKHTELMAARHRLEHDFAGEPVLARRLTGEGAMFSSAGENLADSASPQDAQMEWMLSTPHRGNILNAGYNAVGFGVVKLAANRYYFTEDFIHRVPAYSPAQLEELVLGKLNALRARSNLPPLTRRRIAMLRQEACREQVKAQALGQIFASAGWVSVVESSDPGDLPGAVGDAALHRQAQSVALGACYLNAADADFYSFRVIAIFFRKPGD